MAKLIAEAVQEAIGGLQPASIVYGAGHCNLATHRDFWDPSSRQVVCGFNPDGPADTTLQIARIDDTRRQDARRRRQLCLSSHDIGLGQHAHQFRLHRRDARGRGRAVGGLCVFLQGPRATSARAKAMWATRGLPIATAGNWVTPSCPSLESLPTAGDRYEYAGPVVSGATIGVWRYAPLPPGDESAAHYGALDSGHLTSRIALTYRRSIKPKPISPLATGRGGRHTIGQADSAPDCRVRWSVSRRQLVRSASSPRASPFPLTVRCDGRRWVSAHVRRRVLSSVAAHTPATDLRNRRS